MFDASVFYKCHLSTNSYSHLAIRHFNYNRHIPRRWCSLISGQWRKSAKLKQKKGIFKSNNPVSEHNLVWGKHFFARLCRSRHQIKLFIIQFFGNWDFLQKIFWYKVSIFLFISIKFTVTSLYSLAFIASFGCITFELGHYTPLSLLLSKLLVYFAK